MPRRKHKHPALKIISDEILPSRRSSLQVNLSYVSNFSDSGNCSFASARHEDDVRAKTKAKERNKLIRPCRVALQKISENLNSKGSVENPVSNVMIERETALDESCRALKDAIWNKTREIYDDKAELVTKTAAILKGQRRALAEINRDSQTTEMLKNVTPSSMIKSPTSKSHFIRQNLQFDSSRKALKSLSRISRGNKTISLKSNDESSKIKEKASEIKLTGIDDPKLDISMESGISDIGPPVTCSSFIAGHENFTLPSSRQAKKDLTAVRENSRTEESTKNIETSSLTPMEITAIQIQLLAERKTFSSVGRQNDFSKRMQNSFKKNNYSTNEPVLMELTNVQNNIEPCHVLSNENTTGTSLNVNMSVGKSSCSMKTRSFDASRGSLRNCVNDNSRNDRVDCISLKVNTSVQTDEKESLNNSNSLSDEKNTLLKRKNSLSDRKNTSSDEKNESLSDETELDRTGTKNVENSEKIISDSDSDSIENISLIERLRNISKMKSHQRNRSPEDDDPSFIQGTPYPPSRSILWKTQIRSETLGTKNNKISKTNNTMAKHSSETSDSDSLEYTTAPNSTVISDNLPCRTSCDTKNSRTIGNSSGNEKNSTKTDNSHCRTSCDTKNPRIIGGSSDNEKNSTKTTNPVENSPGENKKADIRKPGKKKLLPLKDKLDIVSFSPVSPVGVLTKKPITWKPRKNFRKRKIVRAVAEKRIEALIGEKDDENDVLASCSNFIDFETRKEKPKLKKRRKVISKKIVVKKIAHNELFDLLKQRDSGQSVTSDRTSMDVFSQKKTLSVSKRNFKTQRLVIVATGFSKGDVDLVKSIVKELGGAEIHSTVTRRTTHVVSTGVRTINLLRGIIRGCWLINLEWVLKSLEMKEWLNAEEYEMVHFSKAVQENRRDRQIFGRSYVPELFTTCGPIYIEHGTTPSPDVLEELVKTAGGIITKNPRDAKLSVGSNGLREIWILDSITTGILQPINEYQKNLGRAVSSTRL